MSSLLRALLRISRGEFVPPEEPDEPELTGLETFSTGLKAVRALKRKYLPYSGPCLRVRRSNDHAEMDVGFTTSDMDAPVDVASLLEWSAGTDAFVTRIYDQSGNGDHWLQTTMSKQPRVVQAGVWGGHVWFNGTSHSMESTNLSGEVVVRNAVIRATTRSPGVKVIIENGTNLGGNSQNECSLCQQPTTTGAQVHLYTSKGSSYNTSLYNTAFNGPLFWSQFSYPVVDPYREALFSDGVAVTRHSTTNIGSVPADTVGTSSKWYLGARNHSLHFADINWTCDAVYEGLVSDTDKAAISAILNR